MSLRTKPLPPVPPKRGSLASAPAATAASSPLVSSRGASPSDPASSFPNESAQIPSQRGQAVPALQAQAVQPSDDDFLSAMGEFVVPFAELQIGATLGEGAFGKVVKVYYAGSYLAAKMLKVGTDDLLDEVRISVQSITG